MGSAFLGTGTLDMLRMALVQTLAELPMMNRCHNSYPRKYCSRAGTLTNYACVGI